MKRSSLGMLAVSAVVLALVSPAHAVTLVVGGSITDNTLLGAGTYAGSFDWSGVLSSSAQVTGVSYAFTFKDDDNDALAVGPRVPTAMTETAFRLVNTSGGYGSDYWYYYEATKTQTYTLAQSRAGEGAAVTLGSASVAAGSGSTATTTTSQSTAPAYIGSTSTVGGSPGYNYSYGCGSWLSPSTCTGYAPGSLYQYRTNHYSVDVVTLNDQTGTFTVSGSITDAGLLADLMAHQTLSFSLGVSGDLLLGSATLTLDIANNVAAVPEPGTAALAGAGLALLIGVARRRRRQGALRFA